MFDVLSELKHLHTLNYTESSVSRNWRYSDCFVLSTNVNSNGLSKHWETFLVAEFYYQFEDWSLLFEICRAIFFLELFIKNKKNRGNFENFRHSKFSDSARRNCTSFRDNFDLRISLKERKKNCSTFRTYSFFEKKNVKWKTIHCARNELRIVKVTSVANFLNHLETWCLWTPALFVYVVNLLAC